MKKTQHADLVVVCVIVTYFLLAVQVCNYVSSRDRNRLSARCLVALKAYHEIEERLMEGDRAAIDELVARMEGADFNSIGCGVAERTIVGAPESLDPAATVAWIKAHAEKLVFDASLGMFVVEEEGPTSPATPDGSTGL